MSSGIWTLFAMLAFIAIVIWVFLIKDKEDFDDQANMPLDDDKPDENNEEKST